MLLAGERGRVSGPVFAWCCLLSCCASGYRAGIQGTRTMTTHYLDGKRVIVRRAYEHNRDAWNVIGTASADRDCWAHGCEIVEDGNYNHYTVEAEDNNESSKVAGRTFHERELMNHPSN